MIVEENKVHGCGESMDIDGVWEPPTPAKPIPARAGHNSETTSTSGQGTEKEFSNNEFPCTLSLGTKEYMEGNGTKGSPALSATEKDPKSTTTVQNDPSCSIQEETQCNGNKTESQDGIDSVPTPSLKKESKKRGNNGFDLNKKPSQRPRVKKHRPKVYDDSKPKKVPKAKTPKKTKTPKPVTPNCVQERRARSKKEKLTQPTSCIRSLNFDHLIIERDSHHVSKSHEETTCIQNSAGVSVYDNEEASRVSITALKSCKRPLDLDLNYPAETDSHNVSTSHGGSGKYDCFDKIVTSKRNTIRRSRFQNKSLTGDDLDTSVIKNLQETKKHVKRFVYVYRCQKKSSSKTTNYTSTLQVYRRKFNVDCLQSSRKSGPNFPKKFKKPRTLRKKVTIIGNWVPKFLENNKKKRPNKKRVQTTNKRVKRSEGNKEVVNSNLDIDKCIVPLFVPIKKKRSILHTRRRENLQNLVDFHVFKETPKDNGSFLLCQEENFLQITECVPLQEVPLHVIESFTSQHLDVQAVDNSVGALHLVQLQEVPVFEGQSLIPKQTDSELYIIEMTKYIIHKMANLDINGQCKELVVRNKNKLSKALVVKIKPEKPKLQAKVDLDEESMRVWKIVMENNGSQPFEEMDGEKKEWWERQRYVFRGRVDSFIAKMHLIQGNRRFSRWKGSVVDSVVGVYLTQNVSDHLSSSAFMCLAARFPAKSKTKEVVDHDEVNASQESVKSNTEIIEGFPNNDDNMEQNMSTSCVDDFSLTPITELIQTESSNLQDKPHVDEVPNTFRKLLEVKKVDFLKNFYNVDESALNESEIEEQSTLEQEKSKSKSNSNETEASNLHDKLCINETPNTFRKVLELEEADFLSNFCTINIDESSLSENKVQEKSTLIQEKSTHEQEKSIFVQERSTIEEKSTLEQEMSISVQERSTLEQEKSTHEQEKSTLEEEPRIVAPVYSLQSEITTEQGVNAVNYHESKKKTPKKKSKKEEKEEVKIDWEELRQTYCQNGKKEINEDYMDAVDWEAVWRAPHQEISKIIAERGMNNVLALRIKEFLDRMVKDHGAIDIEWLRDVPPDKAKEFLLSIDGIGLKSVECVRLLTLHHNAFPVDTNVGRVATRLGWVPLQPLPEEVQIHLLNSYPMVDTIQKYLYPRLCTLDQKTLYELHYQLITFGKVFCTKKSPNCNACPMRAECRHYASAFASARLALPGPKGSSTNVTTIIPAPPQQQPPPPPPSSLLPPPPSEIDLSDWDSNPTYNVQNCEPIIEVPPSPEPSYVQELPDIEDLFRDNDHNNHDDNIDDDDDEIPTIRLNTEEFYETLKETIDKKNNFVVPDADMSKAIVALTAEAAASFFPARPLKVQAKLRTLHNVYELPDFHPVLAGFDEREQEDPSQYLLAIWPENKECSSCNDTQEETVKGTILIPCRTANRGKFPLNGTYFQVNEVFADDETSLVPMDVPRKLLWNLPRRDLGCGTSATSIFKALSTNDIQHIFWRGSICVRGFNRKTRRPRPLHPRFHVSATVIATEKKKLGKK